MEWPVVCFDELLGSLIEHTTGHSIEARSHGQVKNVL